MTNEERANILQEIVDKADEMWTVLDDLIEKAEAIKVDILLEHNLGIAKVHLSEVECYRDDIEIIRQGLTEDDERGEDE